MDHLFNTEVFKFAPAATSNYTSITKGLSETNKMPGHGRNVHDNDLKEICDYHSFEGTLAALKQAKYAHSPYAAVSTLRIRNLAFERNEASMTIDIQCLLSVICGNEPVVVAVRLAAPGRPYIEADVITAYAGHIVKRMSERVVVVDRHGFHLARGTVTAHVDRRRKDHAVPNSRETAAVLDYCAAIRQLPQKERHFKLDGLPCVPVRVEQVPSQRQQQGPTTQQLPPTYGSTTSGPAAPSVDGVHATASTGY